jgi:RAB protein geranylgeranyltransferase component A
MDKKSSKLEYTLDVLEYDNIIFGTGITESLYSASLAKVGKQKNLIVDIDNSYSSSIRTLNFKEFHQFNQN